MQENSLSTLAKASSNVTILPSIKAMRHRLGLLRTIILVFLNAPDRWRRRKSMELLVGSKSTPIIAADFFHPMARRGYVNWNINCELSSSLIESWRNLQARKNKTDPSQVQKSTGKRFFVESLSLSDLKDFPVFTLVAIEEHLLHFVAREIGMVPHLESVEVVVSHPITGALSASQMWHRDVNDRRMLKLFVYLAAVGDEEGPFTYLPADESSKLPRSYDHYLTDEYMLRFAPKETWEKVIGPQGMAFVIDTGRCFHFGSRCAATRVAYVATFSCGIKYMKYATRWKEILGPRVDSLTQLQRAVCGID